MAEALYRKYRPKDWGEVVGQEHITRVLEESLKAGNIGHAYLFVGSRGLGKTSVARILASSLETDERDLYEIDAASHTGVDNIRELTENIYTLPFNSTYKVYIVDEVHMLSKAAFNAFLKTLEEPPEYVIFILATTELEKVPDTIQSRCQVFTFKKPTRAALADMLKATAKKEGFTLEPSSAELIALLADGSFRDAQSILQKVLSSSENKVVEVSEVEMVTGAPSRALVFKLVGALAEGKKEDALAALLAASAQGVDMKLFLALVLDVLRATLLSLHAPSMKEHLKEQYGEDFDKLLAWGKGGVTLKTVSAFLVAHREIKFAAIPELPLELAILDVLGEDSKAQ
jgi:DNA polymerase-3 subunit gamma/tau